MQELTHWKKPWFWERLKAGEGDGRMKWLDGITDSEQIPGHSEEQGSLVCCSPQGLKESDTTQQLNNNKY